MTFHTITLGCKLNQFDGAAIAGELARRGLSRVEDPFAADVVVLNTCTVTHRADADARRLIRRVRRRNPGCRLLVTGCYAELDPETLSSMDGVDHVFGNAQKSELPAILDRLGISGTDFKSVPTPDRGCDAVLSLPQALHFGDRSRAFLKVQEGCRLSCSYCIIPTVRGPSRSIPVAEIRAAAIDLFAGYHEIVLTGVNTGDYGRDLEPPTSLAALLRDLLEVAGPNRIRLNSLEPLTVTDEIVELFASQPRLAPHLQVPLQSGSPAILRLMRRNYRLSAYRERVERLREAVPGIGLGADVIVGFPGETEERFRETYEFIADSPLNYLHVFSWSARPGTPAAELPERVPEREITRRSKSLRGLADDLSRAFRRGLVGRSLDAVVLDEVRGPGRELRALTGNFVEVLLEPGSARRRDLVRVRIERIDGDRTLATVEGTPSWTGAEIGATRRALAT